MDAVPTTSLLDELVEFVLSRPTLEEVIAYRVPDVLDRRLHYLLDQNRLDEITLEERSELDEFLRLGHMLRMLKAKARLKLSGQS